MYQLPFKGVMEIAADVVKAENLSALLLQELGSASEVVACATHGNCNLTTVA